MAKPGEFNIGFNQLRIYGSMFLAGGSLALGAHALKSHDAEAIAPPTTPTASTETTPRMPLQAKLTDLLPHQHHLVNVYYKHPNTREDYGGYRDGQKLDANCKTIGQYQKFRDHHSKLWFRVNNERAFVNSIHVSNADKLQDLKNCKSP
jgi:hypothetical protein